MNKVERFPSSLASSSSGYQSDLSLSKQIINIPIEKITWKQIQDRLDEKRSLSKKFQRISDLFGEKFRRTASKFCRTRRHLIPTKTMCSKGTSMTPTNDVERTNPPVDIYLKKGYSPSTKITENQTCYPYRYLINQSSSGPTASFLPTNLSAFKPFERQQTLIRNRSDSIRSSDDLCDREVAHYFRYKTLQNRFQQKKSQVPIKVFFQQTTNETLC